MSATRALILANALVLFPEVYHQHESKASTTTKPSSSDIFHVIVASKDQGLASLYIKQPELLIASLIFRRPAEPDKFDVAIEGPAKPTVGEALDGLLKISSDLFNTLDPADKPSSPSNALDIGSGGKINWSLLPPRKTGAEPGSGWDIF